MLKRQQEVRNTFEKLAMGLDFSGSVSSAVGYKQGIWFALGKFLLSQVPGF
jgi:hypothetical protein